MKLFYRILNACFLLFVCVSLVQAQSRRITGKVISGEDQQPVPGVNVVVKGTTLGTVTDIDGGYAMEVPIESAGELVFSFIGYVTQSVVVGERAVVDVVLQPDVQTLEEVVVMGYGVQKKSDITGS